MCAQSLCRVHLFETIWTVACQAPLEFSRKKTGVDCHFLLQWIFLTQGSKPHLLHWQADSLPLSHLRSPPVWQDKLIIIKCLLFYKSPFSLKPRAHLPIHVLRSYLSFNFLASAGDLLCLSDLQTFSFKLLFFSHFNLSYVNFITRPIKECREVKRIIPPHNDKNEYANGSYNTMLIISTKNYDYSPVFKKN